MSSLLLGPAPLSCHSFISSGPLTANTTMTNISQCGYCSTSEDGFHSITAQGSGSCSSALVTGQTTSTSVTDGYGWPTNAIWDVIQEDRYLIITKSMMVAYMNSGDGLNYSCLQCDQIGRFIEILLFQMAKY